MAGSDNELQNRVQAVLGERGLDAIAQADGGRVTLTGAVGSEYEASTAVEARSIDGVVEVDNRMEILPQPVAETSPGLQSVSEDDLRAEATESSSPTDPDRAVRTQEPWSPPTDPVIRPREPADETPEVVGGMSPSSMDELTDERDKGLTGRGDEELADDVRRELREDALTTELELEVAVNRGVVLLRGDVSDMEEALGAEEVARRVPGVVDVIDETRLTG